MNQLHHHSSLVTTSFMHKSDGMTIFKLNDGNRRRGLKTSVHVSMIDLLSATCLHDASFSYLGYSVFEKIDPTMYGAMPRFAAIASAIEISGTNCGETFQPMGLSLCFGELVGRSVNHIIRS
jgi:hypothetical protein